MAATWWAGRLGMVRVCGAPPKVKVRIKAPLNTSTGTRKACLKPARNSLGKLPDTTAGTSPGGGRRPPPGEVLDSVSWILPERVSSWFETRFSGPGACLERCFYPHLYFSASCPGHSALSWPVPVSSGPFIRTGHPARRIRNFGIRNRAPET